MASIIKADNIQKVSDGSNIIKKCGSTTTIGSGACSPIVICGSTVTLGRCGGTVTLACGATQTGFGRTGTVDWCTTAKTAPFTGVSGKGYFVNTTCGAVTVTLPASPSAGDIISIADYASTWNSNAVTLCNNSSKINGQCAQATLQEIGQSITLVYVDGTRGWKNIQDATSNVSGRAYIIATGGTITTCGNYKIHTFTGDGTFTVSCTAVSAPNNVVDYLVVGGGAGGGQGGSRSGGGGGAGGFRFYACTTNNPQTGPGAPLNNFPAGTSITVSATSYPITIGGGGAGGCGPSPVAQGAPGTGSIFSTITSAGGGGGGGETFAAAIAGASGGGAGGGNTGPFCGGAGNTPPTSPAQGNPGGTGAPGGPGAPNGGGGGGGAVAAGTNSAAPKLNPGGAGAGITGFGTANGECSASVQYFAGGGGGVGQPYTGPGACSGGLGGGADVTPSGSGGNAGTPNTGGGGSGSRTGSPTPAGSGGSGIVVIRYRYQ